MKPFTPFCQMYTTYQRPVEYQMPVFVSMQPQMPLHVSVQENKVTKEVPVEKLVYVDKVCPEKTTNMRNSIISHFCSFSPPPYYYHIFCITIIDFGFLVYALLHTWSEKRSQDQYTYLMDRKSSSPLSSRKSYTWRSTSSLHKIKS